MSKKKPPLPVRTFKVTTEAGREYRVYATDVARARQVFEQGKPAADMKGSPLTHVVAKIEEDSQQWKATLVQDERKAPGS